MHFSKPAFAVYSLLSISLLPNSESMKYFLSVLFLVTVLFVGQQAQACEIKCTVLGDVKKENFNVGDEIVVKVSVILIHRGCHQGIENTKFKYDGVKVLGATKWKEVSTGKFERKLKLLVLEGNQKELILETIRQCDKEGGYAKLSLTKAIPE